MNISDIAQLEHRASAQRQRLNGAREAQAEVAKLSKGGALRKGGEVNASSLTQGAPVQGGGFNVLIPQDISHMVYSTMLSQQERCVLLNNLERENVSQVRRERVIKTRHGDLIAPIAMGESSLPAVNRPSLDRIVSTVQYYGVLSELTHVAENVNILQGRYPMVMADGPGGLSFERESAMESLAERLEIAYWHGDNDFSADEGDGFFRQVQGAGTANINMLDLRGAVLTFDKLIDQLAALMEIGYEGKPSALYLPTAMWAPLAKEAAGKNRLDPAKNVAITWNPEIGQLLLLGPTGRTLELKHSFFVSAPFSLDAMRAEGEQGRDFSPMSATNLVGSSLSVVTGGGALPTSSFKTADNGAYIYKFMPIFEAGHPAPFAASPASVTGGDVVKADFNDAAFAASLIGYHWWRSAKDSATVFAYGGKFGRNTTGSAGGTLWYDTNARIPGTYRAAAIHHGDGAITDDILLDAFQDDLGRITRKERMVVGTYRGLSVNMPRKHLAIINAGGISI